MVKPKIKLYSPSWVDRFTDWLNRLPFPIWVSLLLIYVFYAVAFHLLTYVDKPASFSGLDASLLFNSLWGVIPLSFFVYLDKAANTAFDKFSVLIPSKKLELEILRYKMTTMPAVPVIVLTLLMAGLLLVGAVFDPTFVGVEGTLPFVLLLPLIISAYCFAPLLLYQGFRIVSLVRRSYQLVDTINLFQLQPLYAFSGVTMLSGFFWILIMNMNLFGNFVLTTGSGTDLFLASILISPLIILAVATFVLPLLGIHVRIQSKKESALQENGRQIEKVHSMLFANLNKSDHKKSGDLEKSLNSLYRMREQIEKVPTWPWRPGTLRNFLSAVFLPLGLWTLQQILVRMF